MAKFTCEIDTNEKTTKFFLDGNEVGADEFSMGCYRNLYAETPYTECYASFTTKVDENNRTTRSFSFRTGDNSAYSESVSNYNMAREIGKLVTKAKASDLLSQKLSGIKR